MKKQETSKGEGNSDKMREIKIEKLVLSAAGTEDKLERSVKLLGKISGMKVIKLKSHKRIPTWGVRPGLETGCKVTIRGEKIVALLKRLLQAKNFELKAKQFENNHFSFGIHEYIEIPGVEYQREIGIMGLNVTVVFIRKGKRVARKKIKVGKAGKKQDVKKEEIIEFMEKNFNLNIK